MVPILINKDVFEPSYYDFKFTVQNCSYFSTKLTAQKEILQGKAGEHHGQNITAESKWMKICKKTKTWGYEQRFGKKHGGNVLWMTKSQLHSVSNDLAVRSLHSSVFTCGFGHEWLPRRTGNWFPNSQRTGHRLWGRDFILSSPGSLHETASILPSTWIAEFVSAACFLILFHTPMY